MWGGIRVGLWRGLRIVAGRAGFVGLVGGWDGGGGGDGDWRGGDRVWVQIWISGRYRYDRWAVRIQVVAWFGVGVGIWGRFTADRRG